MLCAGEPEIWDKRYESRSYRRITEEKNAGRKQRSRMKLVRMELTPIRLIPVPELTIRADAVPTQYVVVQGS